VLAELAGQWWELAPKHAREATLREFAETEQSLATQRDALDARSRAVADELSQMRSERAAAIAGERIASTQAAELEQLVDQLRLQISDFAEQRDLGLRRADRAEAARQQLDARLHEALETAKSEREDWTEYVRSIENRTLSDVDRSRQEAKDLQVQLNNQAKAQRAIEEQLRKELHAAQAAAVYRLMHRITAGPAAGLMAAQERANMDGYADVWTFNYCEDGRFLLKATASAGNVSFRIMYIMFKAD